MTVKQLIDELMKIPNQEKQVCVALPYCEGAKWVDYQPKVRETDCGVVIDQEGVMTEQPTIKNLNDTLETMRKVYDFKDDETFFYNNFTGERVLHIKTTDKDTGVDIEMSKCLTEETNDQNRRNRSKWI